MSRRSKPAPRSAQHLHGLLVVARTDGPIADIGERLDHIGAHIVIVLDHEDGLGELGGLELRLAA